MSIPMKRACQRTKVYSQFAKHAMSIELIIVVFTFRPSSSIELTKSIAKYTYHNQECISELKISKLQIEKDTKLFALKTMTNISLVMEKTVI